MKKWAVFLSCFFLLQLCARSLVYGEHKLKVGIYDNKPLVFTGSDGKAKGFLIDILEYIGSKEGWQIEYVSGYWAECLERLEKSEIDLLVGVEYSKQRNRIYDFTYETSLSDWGIVYAKKGLSLNQISNLDQKRIAVVHGDIHYNNLRKLAEQFKLNCRFVELFEYDGILELIDSKRVDAAVVNSLYGLEFERYHSAVKSPIIFSPTEVHFAVPKKQYPDLINIIDGHLAALKADKQSVYYRSLEEWSPVSEIWVLPKWLFGALAVAGGLLLLSVATGLAFRAQVKAKTLELSIKNEELELEVAERKRVEETLRLTKFSIDHAGDSVFWLGQDAQVIYVNDAACASLGYSSEELTSMTVHDIDPNFPEEIWPRHWQGLKKRVFSTAESQHRRKDGSVFPVELTINHLEFEGKEYHCTFARDITERKKVEEEREKMQAQLRQAQKMEAVGTLAGGIAHDFNNILQAVQGYAELLILGIAGPQSGQRELQEIVRAAKRGSELTRHLLTFSRKVESELRPTDLSHEVVNVRRLLERTIPKMIKFELYLAKNLKTVNADPGQVEQVLMNLAVNAKDAMPEGGRLVIETENITLGENDCRLHHVPRPGDYVRLTVSDNGHGMDEDALDHIFEPFYTTKGPGKGTGLGLATVYGIVESHNGYITAHSKLGEGSTFKIYLPVVESGKKTVQLGERSTALQGGTETILLVDDEEPIRNLGRQILETFGYKVLIAADGERALEIYREAEKEISMVILDLIMPGMGGGRCLKELLNLDPRARVAIASGYSPDGPSREVLLNGARGFVSKPYEVKHMLKEVRRVLEQD